MKLVSRAEFSRLAGVSKPAIAKAIERGLLTLYGEGRTAKIDVTSKDSIDYMARDRSRPLKQPERPTPEPEPPPSAPPLKKQSKRKAKPLPDEIIPSGEEIPTDLNAMSLSTANRLKAIEAVKQAQIKNAKDRGQLISRDLVRQVLSQIFTIDVNEWRTLSANLTPELASVFGIHDAEKLIEAEARIDQEVFAILQHSKRITNDFLKSIEAEGLK